MRGLFAPLLALGLAGCVGGMIPGQIYSEQGKVLEFQIEKSRGAGAVTAFDPATGEHYAGNYVGIREVTTTTSGAFVQSGNTFATGTGFGTIASNMATSTAYLTGDKGSMLNCDMQIQAGFSPHGIGGCSDQKGGRYRLQF
jgi:hypothetical protein